MRPQVSVPSLILLSVAITLGACSDTAGVSDEGLIQRLIDLGFRPDMIENRGDHFMVEGDIMIWKNALPRIRGHLPVTSTLTYKTLDLPQLLLRQQGAGPSHQYRATNTVAPGSLTINVDIQSTEWRDATLSAMGDWNAITESRVQFNSGTPADITVRVDAALEPTTCAAANFPVDSPSHVDPGPEIRTNPVHDTLSFADKKLVIAHELGHTIGFRHTNWFNPRGEPNQPFGAIRIGSTPDSAAGDSASVMNGGTCGRDWSAFSFWDLQATRVLYNESPTLAITMQPNNDRLLTWTSLPGAVSYKLVGYYQHCWDTEFGYTCDFQFYEGYETTALEYLDTLPTYPGFGYPGEACWVDYWVFPRFEGGQGMLLSNIVRGEPMPQPCGW